MSRRDELARALRRYAFGAMGRGMIARLVPRAGEPVRSDRPARVELIVAAPDIHDGKLRDYAEELLVDIEADPASWAPAIRAAWHRRLLHEADEGLTFDGELVHDPHGRSHGALR